MENGDNTYRSRGASRPPQRDGETGASREAPLFTEIPVNNARRTPHSGRPDYYAPPTPSRPANRNPYGGRAPDSYMDYAQRPGQSSRPASEYTNRSPRDRRIGYGDPHPSATFTEISWDSFREGKYNSPTPPAESVPEAPAKGDPFESYYASAGRTSAPRRTPQTPPLDAAPDPFYAGQTPAPDYRQYSQPVRQSGGRRSAERSAPAHRASYVRPGAPRATPGHSRRPAAPVTPPPSVSRPAGNAPGGPRRPRRRGLHPVFYVIALVLAALLILGVSKLAGSARNRTPKATPVQYIPGSAVTPAPATATPGPTPEGSAEATPEITPTPSPVPSPTPSGPKAARSGNRIVPADWGVVVPERTHTVYDSFFDKSCMIGNSLVEGFMMWSGVTNIRYIYGTGAVVNNVIGVLDLAPLTLNQPGYYTDIYLMFGLNEVGTGVTSFLQGYQKLIDFIRQYQPDANIYIISVTPVTQKVDEDPNEVQTMDRINTFNASLKEFCEDNDCWYLDIYSMLLDGDGYLSSAYAFEEDGKHFEKSGYVAWANYMKTHYVDSALVTE